MEKQEVLGEILFYRGSIHKVCDRYKIIFQRRNSQFIQAQNLLVEVVDLH